jgi:urease accessory protein UreH
VLIAPVRTASGEAFDYDQLEFSIDLRSSGKLIVRECYRLTSQTESIQAVRRDFPCAYFASAIVWQVPVDDSFQRAVSSMSASRVLAGASRPAEKVYAIKLVAADSMSLRAAVGGIRALGYSYLGWPKPPLCEL